MQQVLNFNITCNDIMQCGPSFNPFGFSWHRDIRISRRKWIMHLLFDVTHCGYGIKFMSHNLCSV